LAHRTELRIKHPLLDAAERLTTAQVAALVGKTYWTIRQWMTQGIRGVKLRYSRLGGSIIIMRADLDQFLKDIQEEAVNA
jgi:excisionase family DNA binding protein